MPWKLFFPRNRASSYERKSHVLRANERVAWVEQRNFAVFTRYALRSTRIPTPPITVHKFPLSFTRQRWISQSPLLLPFEHRAIFFRFFIDARERFSLSLSLHQRSATTVNHVALCRDNEICWRRDIESREPREIWNWSMEGKKSGREKIPSRGKERFEIPVPSSSSSSTSMST